MPRTILCGKLTRYVALFEHNRNANGLRFNKIQRQLNIRRAQNIKIPINQSDDVVEGEGGVMNTVKQKGG